MLGACQWSLWENGEQIGLGWGEGGCSGSGPTTCQLWAPRSSGGGISQPQGPSLPPISAFTPEHGRAEMLRTVLCPANRTPLPTCYSPHR